MTETQPIETKEKVEPNPKEKVDEEVKSVEQITEEAEREETVKHEREMSPAEKRAEMEKKAAEEHLVAWAPKTQIGKDVKSGKLKDIDEILEKGKKILEPEIVDSLLNLGSELLSIGQMKGKFGGGKRRAWRQTQKKTKQSNIVSFSAMAVVGDKKGHVGIGYGKAKETLPAREKAVRKAKLAVIKIQRGCGNFDCSCEERHSVPFVVEGKSGSVRIKLIPAPQGTGLVAGDEVKKILRLAGIQDIYTVTKGQVRTTFNLAKACFSALNKTNNIEK